MKISRNFAGIARNCGELPEHREFCSEFLNFLMILTRFAEILRKSSRWLEPMASSRRLEPASSRLFASPAGAPARAAAESVHAAVSVRTSNNEVRTATAACTNGDGTNQLRILMSIVFDHSRSYSVRKHRVDLLPPRTDRTLIQVLMSLLDELCTRQRFERTLAARFSSP